MVVAGVRVDPRLVEVRRERLPRVQVVEVTPEVAADVVHERVGIHPGHGVARLDGQRRRREAGVHDLDRVPRALTHAAVTAATGARGQGR